MDRSAFEVKSQQWKRRHAAGAPLHESLFMLTVLHALRSRLMGARDLIIASAPLLAWKRADPDTAFGYAPAQYPRPLLRGYRVHTLLCRGSGLPLFFLLSPANFHDVLSLSASWHGPCSCIASIHVSSGLMLPIGVCTLIPWIHSVLGAVAVIPWNPKRRKIAPVCLPPGPKKNWANAVLSSASLVESFSSFISNALRCPAGLKGPHKLP